MGRKRFKPKQIVAILPEAEREANRQALFHKTVSLSKRLIDENACRWARDVRGAADQSPKGRKSEVESVGQDILPFQNRAVEALQAGTLLNVHTTSHLSSIPAVLEYGKTSNSQWFHFLPSYGL